MATNPIDPVEEELRLILANPRVKARLDAYEDRKRRGKLERRSHDEARRIVGLPPMPEHD